MAAQAVEDLAENWRVPVQALPWVKLQRNSGSRGKSRYTTGALLRYLLARYQSPKMLTQGPG